MKLAFVEMAGFRGFKDRTRFELPSGFVVLTGRNGAGKSTVLDAVDFAFTGTINKFAVTAAKGGGLDSHIWWVGAGNAEQHYVSVGFVTENGDELKITRSRERGLESNFGDLGELFCVGGGPNDLWPKILMQTSLIRDETLAGLSLDLAQQARFEAVQAAIGGLAGPDHSVRTKELLNEANGAKAAQERRVQEVQDDLSRALGALTETRSAAERQADVAEAERTIGRLFPRPDQELRQRPEELRRLVAARKQAFPILMEVIDHSESLQPERDYQESQEAARERADAISGRDAALLLKEAEERALSAARGELAAQLEANAIATTMAELLNHGEEIGLQEGHCPLCDAVRSDAEFAESIARARARLDDIGSRASEAADRIKSAQRSYDGAVQALADADGRLALIEARRDRLAADEARIKEVFENYGIQSASSDPARARDEVLLQYEEAIQLEQALFILETSPVHDQVTSAEAKVDNLRAILDEEQAKLTSAERAVEAAKQIDSAAKSVANQVLKEQFDTVMPLLKELYQRLRPHTDWREIDIDFGGRVRASLNLTVGDGRNPQFLFSSGQRRAAGLAFLLAIHLSRPWCKVRSLLLDDPVQHIDDYRALNLVEVLAAVRRTGRQVIVAVEDHALADVLCRRLRSTPSEFGRRFELGMGRDGSSRIQHQLDVVPMPGQVLQEAS
jgi:DNA repair exonuclease SbcCD ATPase subunit